MNKIFTNHPFVFLGKVLLSFSVTDEDVSFDLLNRFKKGNTSIWGSLPKFSTGYFQVILDEVRSGQVRS